MFTLIVTTTIVAVLYGLAWSNQPVRGSEEAPREDHHK